MTTAATVQRVFLLRTLPLRQLPRALCLEGSIIIPQASRLSAAAPEFSNSYKQLFVNENHTSVQSSLTRQPIGSLFRRVLLK